MIDDILVTYFPRLEKDVIVSILEYLPSEYLINVFLDHPSEHVKEAAFAASLGKGIAFDFVDDEDWYPRPRIAQSVPKCLSFLDRYKGKRFRKLKLSATTHSQGIDQMIASINTTSVTETHADLVEGPDSFGTNTNFRSLQEIRSLTMIKFVWINFADNFTLSSHPQIRFCSFVDCHISDWLLASWPANLDDLDIHGGFVNYSTLNLPPLLKRLLISASNPEVLEVLERYSQANGPDAALKHLVLGLSSSTMMKLDFLPSSLLLVRIMMGSSTPSMTRPKETDISLIYTPLGAKLYYQPSPIAWPPMLKYLDVDWHGTPLEIPGTMRSLPKSLETLKFTGNEIGGHDLVFPRQLELLTCKDIILKHAVFPRSLKQLHLSLLENEELENYDEERWNDGPKWAQLVNLKKLQVVAYKVLSFLNWHPPPNLRELDLLMHGLPALPLELDSLHTLRIHFTECYLHKYLLLPRNLKVFKAHSTVFSSFRVPILACRHRSLETIKIVGMHLETPLQFALDLEGTLVLKLLDLLSMVLSPHVDTAEMSSEAILQLYDDVERAFDRTLTVRPRELQGKHFLITPVR